MCSLRAVSDAILWSVCAVIHIAPCCLKAGNDVVPCFVKSLREVILCYLRAVSDDAQCTLNAGSDTVPSSVKLLSCHIVLFESGK